MITNINEFKLFLEHRNIDRTKLKPLIEGDLYTLAEVQLYQSDNFMSADIIFDSKPNDQFIYTHLKLKEIMVKHTGGGSIYPAYKIFNLKGWISNKSDEDVSITKKLMDKLLDNVKIHPIVINEHNFIMDGIHRFAAYWELKRTPIPVFKRI